MKNINEVCTEYLVDSKTEKAKVRIDVYTKWNSMTQEERIGWYEANQEHFTFTREDAKKGLEEMVYDLVEDGYVGMGEAGIRMITEDHIDRLMEILEDITRGPVFLAFEEFGEMIDPDVPVANGEPSML